MPVSAGEMISPNWDNEVGSTFPVLPLLFVVSLLVIVILSASLYYYKRRLSRTQEYLVRYISDNLELKKLVPTSDRPYHFNPPEITPEEFTKIIDNMLRRIMFLPLLMLFVLPLGAQEKTDSVYEFRFVAGNENCFVTRNHPAKGDWVTVRLRIAAPADTKPEAAVTERNVPEEKNRQNAVGNEATAADEAIKDKPSEAIKEAPATETYTGSVEYREDKSSFSLRANLLRWATLTPDLGVEWRMNRNIGILVNGTWTSWSWSDKDRKYALWKLSPEVRYYIGKEKRGFVGAMYHIGEFNYKLSDNGKQGDYQGGGITGGYTLELTPSFSLDFHAGVGYTRAEYDKYKVTDGVRVRCDSAKKDYWGLNQVGVTLVWKFVK